MVDPRCNEQRSVNMRYNCTNVNSVLTGPGRMEGVVGGVRGGVVLDGVGRGGTSR